MSDRGAGIKGCPHHCSPLPPAGAHRSPPPPRLAPPQARSSHTLTAVGDELYLWGGEHEPRVPIGTDLYAYSLTDRRWRKVEVRLPWCRRVVATLLPPLLT